MTAVSGRPGPRTDEPEVQVPVLPPPSLAQIRRDFSFSAALAGLIAVLVSYSASIGLFVQAFGASHFTPAQAVSAMTALYVGMGVIGMYLSWRWRSPVIIGWVTPGLAILAQDGGRFSYPDILGALVVSALVSAVLGYTGLFERLTRRIPAPLAAALLAGVLLPFALRGFASALAAPLVVGPMVVAYLLLRGLLPRYAVLGVLLVGFLAAAATGGLHAPPGGAVFGSLLPVLPGFHPLAMLTLSLPILLLGLASQNLPGVAILRFSGYKALPTSPLVGATGLVSLLVAPFGAINVTLAAITAAICTTAEAHPDAQRRYVAGIMCAFFYLLLGLFAGAVIGSAGALPPSLIGALAGLALLGTIISGLEATFAEPRWRESAALTLIVTASGVSLYGLSSPVWGLIVGGASALLLRRRTS